MLSGNKLNDIGKAEINFLGANPNVSNSKIVKLINRREKV